MVNLDSGGVKRTVKSWTTKFWQGFLENCKISVLIEALKIQSVQCYWVNLIPFFGRYCMKWLCGMNRFKYQFKSKPCFNHTFSDHWRKWSYYAKNKINHSKMNLPPKSLKKTYFLLFFRCRSKRKRNHGWELKESV